MYAQIKERASQHLAQPFVHEFTSRFMLTLMFALSMMDLWVLGYGLIAGLI